MEEIKTVLQKRFAFRIADHLPKPLKVIYYIILWLTAVYLLYCLVRWLLISFQKAGAFMFDKRNYWTAVWVVFIMAVGSTLIAQFWYGLDPIGHTIRWFESLIRGWIPV